MEFFRVSIGNTSVNLSTASSLFTAPESLARLSIWVFSYYWEFVLDFEQLYYQRDMSRFHFVRQCIHTLIHLIPEVLRVGSPSCVAQWTMERVIGMLTREIRQPSNPFSNLSRRAVIRGLHSIFFPTDHHLDSVHSLQYVFVFLASSIGCCYIFCGYL